MLKALSLTELCLQTTLSELASGLSSSFKAPRKSMPVISTSLPDHFARPLTCSYLPSLSKRDSCSHPHQETTPRAGNRNLSLKAGAFSQDKNEAVSLSTEPPKADKAQLRRAKHVRPHDLPISHWNIVRLVWLGLPATADAIVLEYPNR